MVASVARGKDGMGSWIICCKSSKTDRGGGLYGSSEASSSLADGGGGLNG